MPDVSQLFAVAGDFLTARVTLSIPLREAAHGDLIVLTVYPDQIEVQKAAVKDYTDQPYPGKQHPDINVPKYHTPEGKWDPHAQIDTSTAVPATDRSTGAVNYRQDGY